MNYHVGDNLELLKIVNNESIDRNFYDFNNNFTSKEEYI